MSSSINYKVAGKGPAVILMHGLFGAGGNLGALARSLHDCYQVYSLDLPNHGRSLWLEQAGPVALAGVIGDWIEEQSLSAVTLVGHSLGGKVAMELALAKPGLVKALVVADIAPVAYPPHHDAVFAALDAVLDAGCRSREEAATVMAEHLRQPEVIQFLLMSLQRSADGSYSWRFNLAVIKRDYAAVREALRSGRLYTGPVQFIKGGDSDYIRPEHREQVESLFPAAQLEVMPDCGHWLHAQQPDLFNSIVGGFIDQQTAPSGA